jgi:aminoglycoside phosphotransferase (APT) family kinase protein
MTEWVHDLPDGIFEWIAEVGDGEITQLRRHVARREAWIVDVTRPDGSVLEGFLRLQRDTYGNPRLLERETRILQALGQNDIPVPEIHGWNPELRATLMARDPGRSDLDAIKDPAQQRAVMEDFVRIVARFHTIDLDTLGLDDIMAPRPQTPAACALDEVDRVLKQMGRPFEDCDDPLTVYGIDWLRRFAPEKVARVSLVQGDTGPVNFMFQGDRVSSVIDWELGHYGDPLEDLGNIMVRELYNPSGGLDGLFELYERESGIPYDRFRARYYAVQQNVRGMMGIHAICNAAPPSQPLAWYLCYRYLGDRATAQMLAAAMEIEVARPETPDDKDKVDPLVAGALYAQEHDVAPRLDDPFARQRSVQTMTLIRCIDRRARFGAWHEDEETRDLTELLGKRPANAAIGNKQLCNLIRERAVEDAPLIRFLTRKAYRDEWLYEPVSVLYPNRVWSEID